ncbi:MAG: FAD binding domain-containing protein, partial [Acidimicrobiia bacterium]
PDARLVVEASWSAGVLTSPKSRKIRSVPLADQPAAVLALGGTMVLKGPNGMREVAAADFFVDALTTAVEPDEIVTEIRLPKNGGSSGYDKLGRRGGHTDYAVAGAAAWVSKANGTINDCRVALTGVGAKPTLATATAQGMIGTDGSAKAIAAAAEKAADEVNVLEDLYGSVEYKTHLAKVFAKRALTKALA